MFVASGEAALLRACGLFSLLYLGLYCAALVLHRAPPALQWYYVN